jgi:hypothetical protein
MEEVCPWKPKLSSRRQTFFQNLHKLHNLYILLDFYLILLRGVCPRLQGPQSQFEGLATHNGTSPNWHLRINFCKIVRPRIVV